MSSIENALSNSLGSSLIVDIQKVDKIWHQPLELMADLIKYAQDAFRNTDKEISRFLHEKSSKFLLYHVVSTMTGHSLRITDAVLSLLQCGHPDVALGCVRTLFELYIDMTLILLDPTGQRAKQYDHYDLGHFLEKIIEKTGGNDDYREKLDCLKKMYCRKNFKDTGAWTKIPGDNSCPKSMDGKIDYIVKFTSNEDFVIFKNAWVGLNKWAHMTPSASQNLLGLHGVRAHLERARLEAALSGKSAFGLNIPMDEGITFLILVLTEYFKFTRNITNKSYDNHIKWMGIAKGKIYQLIKNDSRLSSYRVDH